MKLLAILLAIPCLVLAALLAHAIAQNRSAWRQLGEGRRPRGEVLRAALVLWSPLALALLVAVVAANRVGAAAVQLGYRLVAVDAWCELRETPGVFVPCTGLDGRLPRARLVDSPVQDDVDAWVAAHFAQARRTLAARPPAQWQAAASARSGLLDSLSASTVLGLEQAPEDTPALVQSREALRALLRTPTPPAQGVLDMMRFMQQRDARAQQLRALTARTIALRQSASANAYEGLGRDAAGRLWLRHQLAHALAADPPRADDLLQSALDRLSTRGDPDSVDAVRIGAAALLARQEAVAHAALAARLAQSNGPGALLVALAPPRSCRVAGVSDAPVACLGLSAGDADIALRAPTFRQSVRRSIDRWHDLFARDAAWQLGLIAREADAGAQGTAAASAALRAWPERIALRRADCQWTQPQRCLANVARAGVEEALARAVAGDLARGGDALTQHAGVLRRDVSAQVGAALLGLDARVVAMRADAHRLADRAFLVHDLLRLLAWLTLAFVVLKSFLYVLALELYHRDEAASMGFDDAPTVQGDYRSGKRVTIERGFTVPMVTHKQLSNADNHVRLAPWPGSSPIARIWHGRYFLFTRGTFLSDADPGEGAEAGARGMVASAGGGEAMVDWRLQPGEEVVFRYEDFFGASENIELHTDISLRLSTLLLGRLFFRYARCPPDGGPGRLLLRADVELVDQAQLRAMPPERLIAWNRHARFSIHSGRTAWTTLVNGYTLVRDDRPGVPPGLVVVSSAETGSNLGTIRYVKRILTALF